jgi:serine/threonine protein kinase
MYSIINKLLNKILHRNMLYYNKILIIDDNNNNNIVYKVNDGVNNYVLKQIRLLYNFTNEYEIPLKINSNYIIQHYNAIVDDDYYYILSKYYKGPDLYDVIFNKNELNTVDDVINVSLQMLYCLNECFKNGYVHLDIKPENFIYDKNGFLILIDFGCVHECDNVNYTTLHHLDHTVGTIRFISSEVLYNKEYCATTDMYSFSKIVLEIISYLRIPMEKFPKYFINLINSCYTDNHKLRPTPQQVIDLIVNI